MSFTAKLANCRGTGIFYPKNSVFKPQETKVDDRFLGAEFERHSPCQLLNINRSCFDYKHEPIPVYNLQLMRLMGLEAIYPKPKASGSHPQHKVYPYLLKYLKIVRHNQV